MMTEMEIQTRECAIIVYYSALPRLGQKEEKICSSNKAKEKEINNVKK